MNALMEYLAQYKFCMAVWTMYNKALGLARTRRLGRPARKNGFSGYTVVTAVYNAEKYLDDYFRTLTGQTLDFQKHIRLILVDDGSTDGSAAVIKAWQKRFPENITYLHQENSGQGAARNLGLPLVATPWVTFIDADDFVDVNYFLHVDNFLRRQHSADPQKTLKMVACNCIRFYEEIRLYVNLHPLRARFRAKETLKDLADLGDAMQLSAAMAFFAVEELRKSGLAFPTRRWPTFEDGYFVQKYLLGQNSGRIAFLRAPRYYYRKRADQSSSLDTAPRQKSYYLAQLREGNLDILEYARRKKGAVPLHLQYAVFYNMAWRTKDLRNAPPPAGLDKAEIEEFLGLCREIFSYLDAAAILSFPPELADLDDLYKAGALAFFKGEDAPFVTVQVMEYDLAKNEICLLYHQANPGPEEISVDGRWVRPAFAKTVRTGFCGQTFCRSRLLWAPVPAGARSLVLKLDGRPVKFRLGKRLLSGTLPLPEARAGFAAEKAAPWFARRYAGTWIFMDRDTNADDNAEHLYRHVRKHAPEQKIFYALRPSSPDWPRLKAEGFNLLAFGSPRHSLALRGCAKIISSHVDEYVQNYYRGMSRHKHCVFLRHGAGKDDISGWLNAKKIDLMLTATRPEYESMVQEGSPYRLCAKNIVLAGFPRHDALLEPDREEKKQILVMPTWRLGISGMAWFGTCVRHLNPAFMDTEYARRWRSFLCSGRLRDMTQSKGYSILFSPHKNVQPYLELFDLPPWVTALKSGDIPMQTLFKQSKMLITDYSSVFFEMALLQKAVLHYHFDRDDIFGGAHFYQAGYFDYERDGFGPLAATEDALLEHLGALMERDGRPEEQYLARMREAFPFRDGKNCERAYRAIKNLDEPFYNPDGRHDG